MESVILRAVGHVGMVHAIAGFILSVFVLFTPEPASLVGERALVLGLQQAARIMDEALLAEATPRSPHRLLEVVSTSEFRSYVLWFAAFGAGLTGLLVFACRSLVRSEMAGTGFFLVLMGVNAVYVLGLPVLLAEHAEPVTAATAWGIGNLGLSPMMVSYYWLWGPLLVLLVVALEPRGGEPPSSGLRGSSKTSDLG